ncbi:hypothetical protein KNE206_09660 [Kitasatospora sp. NE20-6]|uniref:hypothetical protein n=1 Tax=Kitasatospora sp. NE20-6 TaxID=2859066 RepID=UPI0034DCB714
MVDASTARPADGVAEGTAVRPSLASLAATGADELAAQLHRALPDVDSGRMSVAAFNSSV